MAESKATRADLLKLAEDASDQATDCSQRGDVEGSFYARGLRDAYRTVAMCFVYEDKLCTCGSPLNGMIRVHHCNTPVAW